MRKHLLLQLLKESLTLKPFGVPTKGWHSLCITGNPLVNIANKHIVVPMPGPVAQWLRAYRPFPPLHHHHHHVVGG